MRKHKLDDDQHQYAMTETGEWVHARNGLKDTNYYCDCPERHRLKFVPPSGRKNKRKFDDYFAHYGKTECMAGGESMKHRLAKHRIRELAPILSFVVETCPTCGFSTHFQSDGHTVRLEVQSIDKRRRYDCVAYNAHGTAVCALEVRHTHASSQDKIDSTRSSDTQSLMFAEFMADDVLASTDGRLHNVEVLNCRNCNKCVERAAAKEAERLEYKAAGDASLLKYQMIDMVRKEHMFHPPINFGVFFLDKSKLHSSSDDFIQAFAALVHNADEMSSINPHQYDDITRYMQQASVRYERAHGIIKRPSLPIMSMFYYNVKMIPNAVRWATSLHPQQRVQLIVALTLLVGTDVEFAVEVFHALVFGREDADWTFKLFVTFIQLAISGALRVAGPPWQVVWWLCTRGIPLSD